MWEIVPDDRYAANPANGSGHNRGIAVDLTLTELKTGNKLPMPTDYDDFTDSAHHTFMELDSTVLANRNLLKGVMEHYGFKALETEWWHYSLPNAKYYPLMDISFKKLRRWTKKQMH
jgi:D-alanyl-D-alanine dipeptidase